VTPVGFFSSSEDFGDHSVLDPDASVPPVRLRVVGAFYAHVAVGLATEGAGLEDADLATRFDGFPECLFGLEVDVAVHGALSPVVWVNAF